MYVSPYALLHDENITVTDIFGRFGFPQFRLTTMVHKTIEVHKWTLEKKERKEKNSKILAL